MSKHTPGEWQAVYRPHQEFGHPDVERYDIIAGKRRILDGFVINGEDARLIAAAPELLHAAKRMMDTLWLENPNAAEVINDSALAALSAAIAKAEGRA